MSLMVKPPPVRSVTSLLKREWLHLEDMSITTVLLVAVPSLMIFFYNPLLPLVAYPLQLWAASSSTWRDRWASMRVWRRQSIWWLAFLALCIALDLAHAWMIPTLIAAVQTFWRATLPGQLTLSPIEIRAGFLARIVLLLPAAPWLTSYYEWVNPRTRQRLTRILTDADFTTATPAPAKPATPLPTSPEPEPEPEKTGTARAEKEQQQAASPPTKTKSQQQKPLHRKKEPMQAVEQLTIDSYLAPDQSSQIAKAPMPAPTPPPEPDINWDDIRE